MAINRRTIISSFAWKLMEKISVQGISFVVSIVLARILCPSDYGIVALILVFINIANVIIDGGLNVALIQKKDATQEDFSTIFWTSLGMSLILYIGMFVAAPHIASYYSDGNLTGAIRVLSLCLFPYAVNSIQRAYVSRGMLFKKLFVSNLWATAFSGIIGILLAWQGFKHWALIWFQISQATVLAIVMWYTVKWRPTFTFSSRSFSGLFDYGWKIFLSNLANTLFINVRSLLIGKMYTPATLAYFERGKQLPALVMENINTSVQTVLFPAFSQEQDNKQRVTAMLSRSTRTCNLFILPIMMWIIVCAEQIIRFLLTDKWIGTVPYIQLFCIAYMLMPVQIANLEAIKSQGRSDIILKLSIFKIALDVAILLGTLMYGPIAIASGIVLYNFLCVFINLRPTTLLLGYGLRQQLRDIMPSLAATMAMGILTYMAGLFGTGNTATLAIRSIVALASYLAICHCFRIESFMYITAMLHRRK